MTLEQLVADALHAADDYAPSPDLFEKVERSIEEDAAYRARVRRVLLATGLGVVAVLAYVAVTADFAARTMPLGALEWLTTALLVVAVVVLGPAIRRFGEQYEREVFRSNPDAGTQVLSLLDIAYYLIFGAYIVMTLFNDPGFLDTFADWLRDAVVRIGGLLMLMGVLHVALLLALPVAGLVLGANERRLRIDQGHSTTDPGLDRVDKVITIGAWVIAGLVVLQLVGFVLNLVVLIGAPG